MTAQITLILHDWFNAVYSDGVLVKSGKPSSLSEDTLLGTYPQAAVYEMEQDVYDELLDGNNYPQALESVPLARLQRVR